VRDPFTIRGSGTPIHSPAHVSFIEAAADLSEVLSRSHQTVARQMRFSRLLNQWRKDTRFHSSLDSLVMDQSYQQILAMGHEALPLILREIERQPDHLFWALSQISGEDPVPESARGDIEKMRDYWLKWGRESEIEW